jgi:phage tail protein X
MYEGSRYTNVYSYDEEKDGKLITAFNIRTLPKIDYTDSIKHTWIQSDRLDILAYNYYGDTQYWWFILDANPQYFEEHEIKNGDILLIPPYSELLEVIEDDEEV